MIVPSLHSRREAVAGHEVDDFQRARILSAMVVVSSELGYLGAAVAPVVARAGVSRRTFYELFDGREDCFLAAFDWGVAQAQELTAEAYASRGSWRGRVRQALAALLGLFDSEPELARMCIIEALGAGKLVLERRSQVSDELIAVLKADAPKKRTSVDALPLLTAEGVIGGAFSVIHGHLLEQRQSAAEDSDSSAKGSERDGENSLIKRHGQLMALIVLPYLGPQAAGEELTRPAPEVPQREIVQGKMDGGGGRLLERLDMRLTYRTVRCLIFIGEHPGSSNREIANGAEISDEGQASKLLGRLVKHDLIANSRPPGPGFPNHWVLTAHGKQVLGAVQGR